MERDAGFKLVVTVEEHMITGGLGSAVAEFYSDREMKPIVHRIGVDNLYPAASEYDILLKKCGLDREHIFDNIQQRYQEIKEE